MAKKYPKLSVITVVRNDVENIERTIKSVIEQDYSGELEFVIIDGASTDGTVDVINKYSTEISYFVSEPDRGVYDAMNKGMQVSTGDFVNFLNSGDTYHSPDAVSSLMLETIDDKNTVVYGNVSVKYWDGVYVEKPKEFFNTYMKFKGIGINHQTMFYPGSVIRAMQYDLSYKIVADYDLTFRMWKDGVHFIYRDVIIADYEWGNGISSNPKGLISVYKENARVAGQSLNPLYWIKLMLEYYRFFRKK